MSYRKRNKCSKMKFRSLNKAFKKYNGKGVLNGYLTNKYGKKFRYKQWIQCTRNMEHSYIRKLKCLRNKMESDS